MNNTQIKLYDCKYLDTITKQCRIHKPYKCYTDATICGDYQA